MPTNVYPINVEEQYELVERKALSVDTGGGSYAILTVNPKVLTVVAKGDDIIVDTKAIDSDSPMVLKSGALTFTLKGKPTTVYAKANASSGVLYIMVFA
jgi:hypothetical protein